MWQAEAEAIAGGHRYRLAENETPLSAIRVLELLRDDDRFAHWLTGIVATSPYPAVYWEMPPLCATTLDSPAEFVLLDAPGLARMTVDPQPFAEHFARREDGEILVFPNLGGDALLVVPAPLAPATAYVHFAGFLRHAPREQVRQLWRTLSAAVMARTDTAPLWVSTAGDAVAWLHLRLDSRPKYYHYRPYMARP